MSRPHKETKSDMLHRLWKERYPVKNDDKTFIKNYAKMRLKFGFA